MKDKKWLEENGYTGLYVSGECGCEINDIAPCGDGPHKDCRPGYVHLDPRPGHKESGDFAIFRDKETPNEDDWAGVGYC